MGLLIAPGLELPIEVVTEKLAIVGRTGSGKSYLATKLAELMYHAKAQFVALDPVGVWYGLRLASNGKGPGISVPVFGGLHGDVPLEPSGGALVADLVVDRGISLICDVSQFEYEAEKARFGRDFAARFFFRKKASPSAVHVFLEECQEFIPQNLQRGEEQMLHAFQRMWKLGRNFGIGGSLISQRPQDVNKKALNLTECVFAFQFTGPHERKALESWIAEKGVEEDIKALLPKLAVGQAKVWSPAWLRISETVKILPKETFNASSTPVVGRRSETQTLAPIDLEQIRQDMAATIERAKAEDPKELRKQIAALEKKPTSTLTPQKEREIRLDAARSFSDSQVLPLLDRLESTVTVIQTALQKLQAELKTGLLLITATTDTPAPIELQRLKAPEAPPKQTMPSNGRLGNSGLRRMMIVLAQRGSLTSRQLGLRAGLSPKSGTFTTYLGTGRSNDWIIGSRNELNITPAGREALGIWEPLPEGRELLLYWLEQLGNSGAARMLRALASRYPKSMTSGEVAEAAGISALSGTFTTYLGKLRTLELVTGNRNELKASEELF